MASPVLSVFFSSGQILAMDTVEETHPENIQLDDHMFSTVYVNDSVNVCE